MSGSVSVYVVCILWCWAAGRQSAGWLAGLCELRSAGSLPCETLRIAPASVQSSTETRRAHTRTTAARLCNQQPRQPRQPEVAHPAEVTTRGCSMETR